MNEEITLRLETFNDKEYILADDCIKTIGIHRKTNSKLHEEIERLNKDRKELISSNVKLREEKIFYKNIVKEVREYIDRRDIEWGSEEHNHVLEILDKENNNEDN